ncbi:MAG: GNAT family N-acetyltransferase [Cyanobacteria bacterium REEB459]|nr:GNAT family N-acetyltransferase [Cyanobacteria bacterium REEB459]
MIPIRAYRSQDWPQLWSILEPIFRAGETYVFDPDISAAEAQGIWVDTPPLTFVAEDSHAQIVGSYYLKPNQPGLGSHVCNCGYVVAEAARGQGIGAALCHHSQVIARAEGFRAMQFNLVVATNHRAVHLWQKLGFEVVGRLPAAFNHRRYGYVDALVMYKSL